MLSELNASPVNSGVGCLPERSEQMDQTVRVITRRINIFLKAIIAILFLTFFQFAGEISADALSNNTSASIQADWQRLSDKEDNFSVLLPVRAEITSRGNYTIGLNGEKIIEERVAHAYHNGVVYIVKLYKASNLKRLFAKYHELFYLSNADETSLTAGGFEGKQFLIKEEGYFSFIRVFLTKNHLYVLEAAARSADNASVQYFLSSLTLGNVGPAAIVTAPPGEAPMPLAPADSKPLTVKEATLPAVPIYNPKPPYTPRAKQDRVSGTLTLRILFSPTGEVTEVTVINKLGGGLTEAAIKMAKSIKFLPAEKDGQLVPQIGEMTYTYKIY